MKSQYKWGLAAASVLVLGFASVQQTGAAWRSSTSGPSTTLTAGKLDISAGQDGVKQFTLDGLALENKSAGASVQKPLPVVNSGNLGMSYNLKQVTLNGQTPPPMDLRVAVVGSESECTATGDVGTQIFTGAMASATTSVRRVAAGAAEVLCLRATLGQGAAAGQSATATFTFGAAVDR